MSDKEAKAGLKTVLGLFVYSFTTMIIVGALVFWWAASAFKAPGPLQEPKLISIERGSGLNAIAAQLANEGVIENHYIFIFGSRILGAQSDLKAGEYEIQPAMSARDVMVMLRDHNIFARRFTVREGLTSHEVVRIINEVENLSGDIPKTPPEGSLLPNTYDYQMDEPRDVVVTRLYAAMASALEERCGAPKGLKWEELMRQPCGAAPLNTVGDVLTLASIVEKETGKAEERGLVAGVFINRLRQGIALQTDPSVIYAITKGQHKNDGKGPLGRRLLSKDLEIDSPYNTYKYPGLPPGPIANPGLASIDAVLAPTANDYIYFVADGSGGHAFAKTLAEHNANVEKWRKIRNAQ